MKEMRRERKRTWCIVWTREEWIWDESVWKI